MTTSTLACVSGAISVILGAALWRQTRILLPVALGMFVGALQNALRPSIPEAVTNSMLVTSLALMASAFVFAALDYRRLKQRGDETAVGAIWRYYQRRREYRKFSERMRQ